ncbi:multisubunit sodium/proton antiporter, MrpE subunit [Deinococcus reticulitermitis]|uniref:Multisubunit sodium/proton antiporter, MrpE subunit n=1 Tax=Deinococcus reticulitermitis TaxID=856736 RepID=A0A1H6XD51_9DEIO|nr:Na+/H+ antiporter subunit E [Deinococcus reticulitermitis]SEJ27069.1 multisubunit sodium/proton antiporter, MrpE subunit [Deinococcus reticulitermitis]
MRGLALNLLIAVVWSLFSGEVGTRELVTGFLIGFVILTLFPQALETGSYVARSQAVLGFLGFFLRELTLANIQIALLALRPRPPLSPVIVAVPLRVQGEFGQTLLAAAITLMPGTVAMGFSANRRVLYAHAVGLSSAGAARASIVKVEDRLLAFLPALPPRPVEVTS